MDNQTQELYDLEAISQRLGVSVPALKRRVAILKIEPVERGSRGKLLFDHRAVALMEAADALLREGDGLTTARRKLGITIVPDLIDHDQDDDQELEHQRRSQPEPNQELLVAIKSLTDTIQVAQAAITDRDQKLIDTLTELRRVSETAAALGERNSNLLHQNQQLQGQMAELKLLAAPVEPKKPFWKFW